MEAFIYKAFWGLKDGEKKLGLQSDHEYPAMSGPAPIQISHLAGYGSYICLNATSFEVFIYACYNIYSLSGFYCICNKLSFMVKWIYM